MSYFLYAETAFHHEGDIDYMIGLVDLAKSSGADGIKFQVLLDYDSLIARSNPGYDDFKRAMFSKEQWRQIIEHARELGLKIVFMPCDLESIELVKEGYFKVDFLDLHSVSFYDSDVNRRIKESNVPLILGVGGRTLDEMKEKLTYYGEQLWCFMVGFQAFPTNLEDVNLEKIAMMKGIFSQRIGYADHSHFDSDDAVESNLRAFNYGARVFEKHLTLTEGEERFDHIASVGEEKFEKIRDLLDSASESETPALPLDEASFELSEPELDYRYRQKIAVPTKDLSAGTLVDENMIAFKMCGNVDGITDFSGLVGKRLKSDVKYDHPILKSDLENA